MLNNVRLITQKILIKANIEITRHIQTPWEPNKTHLLVTPVFPLQRSDQSWNY